MTMMVAEVLRWCKQKREKRNQENKSDRALNATGEGSTQSYHGIVANGGGVMQRGTAALLELAIERRTMKASNKHLNNQTK